ncbi:tautomerase family protein [Desulfovibrio mangrovi]|uniref:tautomerase family protein n=1 Tax=Desulfovibrio mangrovi TaxID=2976983 RepID=UPI0022463C6C|nr:tautomerase family protein [Desulfovibrio mangrovi]UZP66514.1 tautomerase family protein [Desulfovibrio mangrovi]
MPFVCIEIRKRYTQEEEIGIIDAVHAALQEAFLIKPDDKHLRLIVHEPHRFTCPEDKKKPECCTMVTIDAFAGRSLDAKRKLYKAIVRNLEPFGIPADHVLTVLREHPKENWGVRGGQAACDIQLGFKIDV